MSPAKKKAPRVKAAAPADEEIIAFATPKAWGTWLRANHAKRGAVWIRYFRKATGRQGLTWATALDEALCWGWIDGQARPYDADSWLQRFTPRRARSGWSKRNRDHVARLEREGRMRAAGRAQVEAAKADGRWERAYDSPSQAKVPADFLAALARHKKAEAFFRSLNRANHYAIAYRLQTAKKPETRARRFDQLLQRMKDGVKLH